jgi:pentatricopeptide repeat protein
MLDTLVSCGEVEEAYDLFKKMVRQTGGKGA